MDRRVGMPEERGREQYRCSRRELDGEFEIVKYNVAALSRVERAQGGHVAEIDGVVFTIVVRHTDRPWAKVDGRRGVYTAREREIAVVFVEDFLQVRPCAFVYPGRIRGKQTYESDQHRGLHAKELVNPLLPYPAMRRRGRELHRLEIA